jgi:hypothetical protein
MVAVSAFAQTPVGKPSRSSESPVIDAALPGVVVSGSGAPIADVTVAQTTQPPKPMPPVPMPPVEKTPETPAEPPKSVTTVIEDAKAPLTPGTTLVAPANNYTSDCCGPVGSHGPVGQEVYFRFGPNYPQGTDRLVYNLSPGWSGQIGLRSQFFNPTGSAAWAVDTHVMYMYNGGEQNDIHTFQTEPVVVRSLHRTAVGLGLGRDWFLAQPGFILDTWDTNFRFGIDGGGRWGSGHIDLRNPFEVDSYRRKQDTFTQVFVGVMGTAEVPFGGWTFIVGVRGEWDNTWSNFLPLESNFQQFTGYFTFGVRY